MPNTMNYISWRLQWLNGNKRAVNFDLSHTTQGNRVNLTFKCRSDIPGHSVDKDFDSD